MIKSRKCSNKMPRGEQFINRNGNLITVPIFRARVNILVAYIFQLNVHTTLLELN